MFGGFQGFFQLDLLWVCLGEPTTNEINHRWSMYTYSYQFPNYTEKKTIHISFINSAGRFGYERIGIYYSFTKMKLFQLWQKL